MDGNDTITPSPRVAGMNKFQKLAALLVILGPDNAASILKGMDDATIESVVSEVSGMELLNASEQQEILNEFTDLINRANASLGGGFNVVEQALLKSLGGFKAANLLGKLSVSSPRKSEALDQLRGMDSVQLFNLLKNEQEQTIALILSHLPPDRAASVSTSFSEEKRVGVLERLATLSPTPSEIVDKVIAVVLGKAQRAVARPLTHPGGVRVAAAMLNAMNKEASKNILTTLEENNPDLGASIKQKMFTFEDLIHLDAQDVQKILRDVDMKDLAMAMKNVPETLINFILSCMSKRAGEGVLEEMEFLTNAKAKDIEAAQLSVVESVRRLEGNDEIYLSVMGGGG
jgi:flagellar motor switch protein FliG